MCEMDCNAVRHNYSSSGADATSCRKHTLDMHYPLHQNRRGKAGSPPALHRQCSTLRRQHLLIPPKVSNLHIYPPSTQLSLSTTYFAFSPPSPGLQSKQNLRLTNFFTAQPRRVSHLITSNFLFLHPVLGVSSVENSTCHVVFVFSADDP